MLTVLRTTPDDPQFKKLILELDRELHHRYGAEQVRFQQHNILDNMASVIVIALDDLPQACGCFRPAMHSGVAEVKRMYTTGKMRGKGMGSLVLAELEKWAIEVGYGKAILETGIYQPDALALYAKAGYLIIENYAPYRDSSYSICMEKILK